MQYKMYVDLLRLHDYINLGGRKVDFRLILRAMPVRLRTSRGMISKKIKQFVAYKVNLIQRHRLGEDISPIIINAGLGCPLIRHYWQQHTSIDVTVHANSKREVSTLEDRFSRALAL